MPSVSGLKEVRQFQLALSSQLVKDCPMEQVKSTLAKTMLKLGIREKNFPNQLESLVLYEYLVEHYGGHRLNELTLAFDMALMGSLCDENGEVVDANCYESFSCLYLSKILNAYRIWSKSEYRALPSDSPVEQRIFTQEELDDYAREEAEWTYQMYLKGFEIAYPEGIRLILEKDNLIKKDELVMDFFKRRATSQSLNLYTR